MSSELLSDLRRRLTVGAVERAIDTPRELWQNRCHEISLALLKSNLFDGVEARMARGAGMHIGSQHSWIVTGRDVYDDKAIVVDPTWSSTVMSKPLVMFVPNLTAHRPHGYGEFEKYPPHGDGEEIGPPDPSQRLSDWIKVARLANGEPLDLKFWVGMVHGPMLGWPSAEVVDWLCSVSTMVAFVPIDLQGMLTDRNPNGLYLRD